MSWLALYIIPSVCAISSPVRAMDDCESYLSKADENHDGELSASEYVRAVNWISGAAFSDTFVIPYHSLPLSLRVGFEYLACRCPGEALHRCCDCMVKISVDTGDMCRMIESALYPSGRVATLESLDRKNSMGVEIDVQCEFVISNMEGIAAADMVAGFQPFVGLTSALYLLSEQVVGLLDDKSIVYEIDDASLNKISDIKCPDGSVVQLSQRCQAVMASVKVKSIGRRNRSWLSLEKDRLGSILMDVITLGFLQESLELASELAGPALLRGTSDAPELALKIFVYAGTVPTTSDTTPLSQIPTTSLGSATTRAPMTSDGLSWPPSASPSGTPIIIVIPNKFCVSNNVGLTSSDFTASSSSLMQLDDSYRSLLELLYRAGGNFHFLGSSIVDVVDFPCKLSDSEGALCQEVKADHTVALLDSDAGVIRAYDQLVAFTEAAVEAGKLQEVLVRNYFDSHLTIRTMNEIEVSIVIRNSFLLKKTEYVNEFTLHPEYNVYQLLQVGYEYMNCGIVGGSAIPDVTYVSNSAELMQIDGVDCPGNSTGRCLNVSASYNVSVVALSGVDELFVGEQLAKLTSRAIGDGSLLGVLHLLNASVPFLIVNTNGSLPFMLEGDVVGDTSGSRQPSANLSTSYPTNTPTSTSAPSVRPSVQLSANPSTSDPTNTPTSPSAPSVRPSAQPSANPSTFAPSTTSTSPPIPSAVPSETPSKFPSPSPASTSSLLRSKAPSYTPVPSSKPSVPLPSIEPGASGLSTDQTNAKLVSAERLALAVGILLLSCLCGLVFGYRIGQRNKHVDPDGENVDGNPGSPSDVVLYWEAGWKMFNDPLNDHTDVDWDDDDDTSEVSLSLPSDEQGSPVVVAAAATGGRTVSHFLRKEKETNIKAVNGADLVALDDRLQSVQIQGTADGESDCNHNDAEEKVNLRHSGAFALNARFQLAHIQGIANSGWGLDFRDIDGDVVGRVFPTREPEAASKAGPSLGEKLAGSRTGWDSLGNKESDSLGFPTADGDCSKSYSDSSDGSTYLSCETSLGIMSPDDLFLSGSRKQKGNNNSSRGPVSRR